MDMQALIQTITEEVLRQWRAENGACVLVLAHRSEDLLERVRTHLGRDAHIVFYGEDTAGRVPQRRVLPLLSCRDMADLAAGRAEGLLQSEVLQLLLAGQSVEVLEFAYKAHALTAPAALYALYQSYEKTLSTYGLCALRPATSPQNNISSLPKLVTEKMIWEAKDQGQACLTAAHKALVTPQAADTARELGISIHKEERGA